MYTFDTNAILYYLKDDPDTVSVLRGVFAQNVPLYVSAITELELFAFSNLSPHEAKHYCGYSAQVGTLLRDVTAVLAGLTDGL